MQRHAPKEFSAAVGSGGVPAAVRDELAEPGAAQTLGLAVFAGGLRIGECRQQLQSATATIGVEPLRYVGHEPSVPSGATFVKAECAAPP